jgi:hypothetical protein
MKGIERVGELWETKRYWKIFGVGVRWEVSD